MARNRFLPVFLVVLVAAAPAHAQSGHKLPDAFKLSPFKLAETPQGRAEQAHKLKVEIEEAIYEACANRLPGSTLLQKGVEGVQAYCSKVAGAKFADFVTVLGVGIEDRMNDPSNKVAKAAFCSQGAK